MILVDTSIWVDHFRSGIPLLHDFLMTEEIATHPFVIGELACGNLRQRDKIISLLETLPQATIANHSEVLTYILQHHLYGKGLGWIDMHLLTSSVLSQIPLWTRDLRLEKEAQRLGIACNTNS